MILTHDDIQHHDEHKEQLELLCVNDSIEMNRAVRRSGYRTCTEHNRPQEFYCVTDKIIVCKKCWKKLHKDHDVQTLKIYMESVLKKEKSDYKPKLRISSFLSNVMTKWENVLETMDAVSQRISSLFNQRDETKRREKPLRKCKDVTETDGLIRNVRKSKDEEQRLATRIREELIMTIKYIVSLLDCLHECSKNTKSSQKDEQNNTLLQLANSKQRVSDTDEQGPANIANSSKESNSLIVEQGQILKTFYTSF